MFFRDDLKKNSRAVELGSGQALLPPGMMKWDIERPGLRGNVYALELPAGNYEFDRWAIYSGAVTTYPMKDFSIPFSIEAGKATYVGNFNFKKVSSWGLSVTGVNLTLQDEANRDMQLLGSKYSTLVSHKVSKAIKAGTKVENIGGRGGQSIITVIY